MHPVLFTIGDTAVHTYGVMGAIGFLVASVIAIVRAGRMGLVKERVADVIFWTSIAAIAGSRAFYVYQTPEAFESWTGWFNLRTGGLVFYGAMITGLPTAAFLMWRYKLPFFKLMDTWGTALPFGHALSRVGCVAAGCCYGQPTDLPWAITFTHPQSLAPHGVPLHPTQLYEVAYLVAIGAVCTWYYPRRRFDGEVMALYLVSYAVARSVNELVRGDWERGFVFAERLGETVSVGQAISLVLAIAAIAVFVVVPRMLRMRAGPIPAA